MNLNKQKLVPTHEEDSVFGDQWQQDFSISDTDIEIHFSQITRKICERVESVYAVVGCSPWISGPILSSLQQRPNASIVVSDEKHGPESLTPAKFPRHVAEWIQNKALINFDIPSDARTIECIQLKRPSPSEWLRLHSKYLVLCERSGEPVGVLTGSFNFTKNAEKCLENIIIINNKKVAAAYAANWYQSVLIALQERGATLRICSRKWIELEEHMQDLRDYDTSVESGVPYGDDTGWLTRNFDL